MRLGAAPLNCSPTDSNLCNFLSGKGNVRDIRDGGRDWPVLDSRVAVSMMRLGCLSQFLSAPNYCGSWESALGTKGREDEGIGEFATAIVIVHWD